MSIYKANQQIGSSKLIFLTWLVYATSYLGKVNYSANITQIVDFYNVTKAEAGLVPSFFFFAYAIGQVVNGIFCKRYNIKRMVWISLTLSGLINLAVALSTNFVIIKWLWMVNGFLLSVLWPTLIRLLSETLPSEHLGRSSVVMGTTVATGTLIIYALSSVYVAFDNFKLAFYTAAVALLAVSVVWLLLFDRAVGCVAKSAAEQGVPVKETVPRKADTRKRGAMATACMLCFCAVGTNFIKDGLTTWIPSILKEEGSMPDSLSILLALFFPIVAIPGNAFALWVHKKIPSYARHSLVLFACMAVLIVAVIGILPFKIVSAMLLGLVIVNLFASSMNSLVTGIFPMFMRQHLNSGKIAGILDGFCYLGSAVSAYGLGALADSFGWNAIFGCMLGTCVVLALTCGVYAILLRNSEGGKE